MPYTEAIMGMLPQICHEANDIWTARAPLISWKRVEWHLPDRVMRQFGGIQSCTIEPMERSFRRVDGRGRAEVDWMHYHRGYIELWNNRRALGITITHPLGDGREELSSYLQWYQSWASLYLLKAPTTAPETIYPRSPGERIVVRNCTDFKILLNIHVCYVY